MSMVHHRDAAQSRSRCCFSRTESQIQNRAGQKARLWVGAIALALMSAPALADRFPVHAKLNGGSNWTPSSSGCSNCKSTNGAVATVCPGEGISVEYKVTISGSTSGTRNWQWTGYTVEGASEACLDTANFTSSGTYTVTFNITAPNIPGTYDLTLDADNNNTCSTSNSGNGAGILALVNAIVVLDPESLACCEPTAANDVTCNGNDDDCDGLTDEDAVNCQLCGETVDACIYIMLDRTGSMTPAALDDEVDAVQDFLNALADLPDPPPVAIGTFGCNGSGFPANGVGHQGFCTGNADDACTLQSLSDTESPAPYGDDDGSTSDGDHYAWAELSGTTQSSTGTHFACALDVVNTELGHGSCPPGKDKILIYLSDGGDQDSLANTTAAANHLKTTHGVEIFALLFGNVTVANQDRMKLVASDPDATHYFEAPDSADILGILDEISSQIACGDSNQCTADICDDNTGVCQFNNLPLGTACQTDADACTVQHCNGSGVCVVQSTTSCPGPANSCDGGTVCNPTTGACDNLPDVAAGTACDRDSNACTLDVCNGSGMCVASTSVTCPGPTGPCDGGKVCNPGSGACVDAADPSAGTACNTDGDLCTLDQCNGTGSCVLASTFSCPGPMGPCDGGKVCNPGTGTCVDAPDPAAGTACNTDSNLCTIDHCNGTGSCVNTGNVSCAAAVPPCEGGQVCVPATGLCQNQPDAPLSTPCQADGTQCTIDHCNGSGVCVTYDNVVCPGSTGACDAGTTCNAGTGACDALPDPAAGTTCEADGNLCTTDRCNGTGSCVHVGDVSCPGPTNSCDGGQVCSPGTGTCVNVPDAPVNTACQADATQCTLDHCDGAGNCVTFDNVVCPGSTGTCDAGTACNAATGSCDALPDPAAGTSCERDGNLCTHDQCDGSGSCVTVDNVVCPGAAGVCDAGQQCVPATGLCANLPDPPLSTPCETDGNLCTNEHCDGNGSCVFLSNVTCPGSTGTCDAGKTCQPSTGACIDLADPASGTACEDDGNLCTIEQCNGTGSCVHVNNVSCPGSTGTCDSGKTCQPSSGTCIDVADPPLGTTCQADGSFCTLDHCDGLGSCVTYDNVVCPGSTGSCDSGTVCTPATGACDPLPDPPTTVSCEEDGNLCTKEFCDGLGSCVYSHTQTCPAPTGTCDAGKVCAPASGTCVDLPDPPLSTPCESDNNLCTLDHCDGLGSCVNFDSVVCQPANPPCEAGEVCTPSTGTCTPLPDAPLSSPCERDGDLCTIDHCDGNGSCVLLNNVVCADPVPPCEAGELCNPSSGLCVEQPDAPLSTTCEREGDLCTIDHCNGQGQCVTFDYASCPGGIGTCDAGTICDPSTGGCINLPDPPLSTNCEADGNFCTLDHCDGLGACVQFDQVECPGPSGVCDGGSACTPATGLCNPVTDPPLSTPCENDSNYCTIEHCSGEGACVPLDDVECEGSTGVCDAGFNCDPSTGTCFDLPDPPLGTPCDADGNLCTIDQCNGSGTCVPNTTVSCTGPIGPCDGGNVCNPNTGECDPLPDPPAGTTCDRDNDLCTIDQCDGAGVCIFIDDVTCAGPNPPCEGGEMCVPATGQCAALPDAPNGTVCELDENLCTIDLCNGQGQCQHDGNVTCQAAKPPCESGAVCNPDTGNCDALPDAPTSTQCERDGNLCTQDHCNGKGQCVLLSNVTCQPASLPCEAGEVCNPTTGNCDDNPDAPMGTVCGNDGDQCTFDFCNGDGSCIHPDNGQCGACCLPSSCAEGYTQVGCSAAGGSHLGPNSNCVGDNDQDGIDDACGVTGEIPTVSEWGLVVLALLLMIGAKLYFGNRRELA